MKMLIRNYGLFWRRNDVFWGRQRNAGHLLGRKVDEKKSEPVNFRDQVGLYALYDESCRLVYFGQAGRGKTQKLFDRLKNHLNDSIADRWQRFSWFGTRFVRKDGILSAERDNQQSEMPIALDHMEAIVLAVAEPTHNKQGGRFGKNVEQYIQFRDEDVLGLSEKRMISEMYKKMVSESE